MKPTKHRAVQALLLLAALPVGCGTERIEAKQVLVASMTPGGIGGPSFLLTINGSLATYPGGGTDVEARLTFNGQTVYLENPEGGAPDPATLVLPGSFSGAYPAGSYAIGIHLADGQSALALPSQTYVAGKAYHLEIFGSPGDLRAQVLDTSDVSDPGSGKQRLRLLNTASKTIPTIELHSVTPAVVDSQGHRAPPSAAPVQVITNLLSGAAWQGTVTRDVVAIYVPALKGNSVDSEWVVKWSAQSWLADVFLNEAGSWTAEYPCDDMSTYRWSATNAGLDPNIFDQDAAVAQCAF